MDRLLELQQVGSLAFELFTMSHSLQRVSNLHIHALIFQSPFAAATIGGAAHSAFPSGFSSQGPSNEPEKTSPNLSLEDLEGGGSKTTILVACAQREGLLERIGIVQVKLTARLGKLLCGSKVQIRLKMRSS